MYDSIVIGAGIAGITMDCPSVSWNFSPSMVTSPTPSRQVTKASPPEACVLISSPFAKENKVTLTASFCASVLLTICPS